MPHKLITATPIAIHPMEIYYNPSCSKCTFALEYLQQQGIHPQLIYYLEQNPTMDELKSVVHKLGLKSQAIVRVTDPFFIENFLGKELNEDEWIQVVVDHPFLLQRPILVSEKYAVIGRDESSLQKAALR